MGAPKKRRLDDALVELGLAPTRSQARAIVLAGEVRVDGQLVDKAGAMVLADAEVRLIDKPRWVGRGGVKLDAALEHFGMDVAGAIAADVGACTGGFTDVLLSRGARRVYAIDVGYGQLDWGLRHDPRVVVMDRTNARTLAALPEPIDIAVIDVAFISLRLVLPSVAGWSASPIDIVALVKPQFEAGREHVAKGGIVRDPQVHRRVLHDIVAWSKSAAFEVLGLIRSPITGAGGNVEFLVRLRTGGPTADSDWDAGTGIDAVLGPDASAGSVGSGGSAGSAGSAGPRGIGDRRSVLLTPEPAAAPPALDARSRGRLEALLGAHSPADASEAASLERIRAFVASSPDPFDRRNPDQHITASAFILDPDGRLLLMHHAKLGLWVQLGGHAELERDAALVAMREAREESGLTDLAFHPSLLDESGDPILLDVDVHRIRRSGDQPAHLHHDLRFLLSTRAPYLIRRSDEAEDLKWATMDDVRRLCDAGIKRAALKAAVRGPSHGRQDV